MSKRKALEEGLVELIKGIDIESFQKSIKESFSDFPDPRSETNQIYPIWYLLFIAISAYLSNAATIQDVTSFASWQIDWINSTIGCTFKAPSYNTFWWLFTRMNPIGLKGFLQQWFSKASPELKEKIFAIDGKRARGASRNGNTVHLVALFSVENSLIFTQERVPDKKCERESIPELLNAVDITGAIISMDAHYSYVEVVDEVISRGADAIIAIKENQPTLADEVQNYFEQAYEVNYEEVDQISRYETVEKGHGRIETRTICVTNDLEWLPQQEKWHLQSLIEVRSERRIKGKVEQSIRYYGSTRKARAEDFAIWVRGHWGIEARHHILDVVFDEDGVNANTGNTAENISLIRRAAMNMIQYCDPERGFAEARRAATYNTNYLRGILCKSFAK